MTIPIALTSLSSGVGAASYATGSITYHANREQLVGFVFTGAGTVSSVTTPTLTFVQITSIANGPFVYRAMGTVDATEVLTVAFSVNPTSIDLVWDELEGPLTGANGANGIITSNNVTNSNFGTSVTLTCPNAVTNAANGIYSWVGIGNNNRTFTTSAGYNQVNNSNGNNTIVSAMNSPESSLTNVWTVVGGFNNTYLGAQTEIGAVVWAGTYIPPRVIRQAPQRAAVR